ncbi:MAG: hypothetical protein ABI870_16255 [Rhodanobacter sp.]
MALDSVVLFDAMAKVVAVGGGLLAAFMGIAEFRRANRQRHEDLRWKQAEMAKQCLDQVRADPLAHAAMKMLDWAGLAYGLLDGGKTDAIGDVERRTALRVTDTVFDSRSDEGFIRDAYDALFEWLERLEQFVRIGLITFDDVEPFFNYYIGRMSSPGDYPVFKAFLDSYGYKLAASFLARFAGWPASGAATE